MAHARVMARSGDPPPPLTNGGPAAAPPTGAFDARQPPCDFRARDGVRRLTGMGD